MCVLSTRATYLIEHVLAGVIVGRRIRLPKAAPGTDIKDQAFPEVLARISGRVEDIAKSRASISVTDGRITLTTGWLCERWCSAYLLLKSNFLDQDNDPILEALPVGDSFVWPANIPDPRTAHDLVLQANRIYPILVTAAVLHEIGHAINAKCDCSKPDMELRCDHFAAMYLLGSRMDGFRDISMLGLAAWFCCLCSESLNAGYWSIADHPNPIRRMQRYLRNFVPIESELGTVIWLLCVGHVMRLARIHNRPALDEVVLLDNGYQNFNALLSDLESCW